MFHLYTSNDAAKLADALGERLCAPRDNPLIPARVLIPQAGLRRWLETHLAEQRGVLANVEFTRPAAFAWELLRAAHPESPRQSPSDVAVLRWHLYALLGQRLDGKALAPLRDYLAADPDPLRRYALSLELARAFERAEGYRRDRLLAWERGQDGGWQAELWRRLVHRTDRTSRAERVEAWLAAFDPEYPPGEFHEKPAPPGLPPQFACFACANVSPDVLRMLAIAGLHCDVDFFLPLPSREYTGDTPRARHAVRERLAARDGGNPLIVSLGGAAAEFLELVYGYEHVQPDAEIETFDDAIPRATLLGRVRDDILKHVAPRADDRVAAPDDSLQFHACHTPLREVETLHDSLLSLFEQHPHLQPRDVAVMTPDVAAYRPAIDAVFGGLPRADARFIPYNLGDLGAAAQHPAVQVFLKLLDAPASRWELDELLDVLAAPGAMRRFDLDTDALERLRSELYAAGARWGEDEQARRREGAGNYREFSWAFAIDRIVAGFATGAAEDSLIGGTSPLAAVEGQAFGHLDAVLAVTETWRRLRVESQRPRPAAAWQMLLNEAFESLYQPDPGDLAESRTLERTRAALAQLADACGQADPALTLPWPDLRAYLRDVLADPDPAQRLFTGGVTFCGMVPLRVVPFRVICLIGMQEDAFPRRERSGLDPLVADRRTGIQRPGDRDVRADDRLLFLQLLAAAREVFYTSWIGRDAHSNEAIPPSVVVAELLDVVRERYLSPPRDDATRQRREARLPRVEPLHAFDPSLFAGTADAARSCRAEWLPAAGAPQRSAKGAARFITGPLPVPAAPPEVLRLEELRHFFENPARGFMEGALQLRLPRVVDAQTSLEPLAPNEGLLRYRLTSALLAGEGADIEREKQLLGAQAALPPGALAEPAFAIANARAAMLRDAIAAFTRGAARVDDITGTIEQDDGSRLTGTVDGVYPAGLVRATAGKLTGKRVLRAWLDTLFATAVSNRSIACRLIWIEREGEVGHRDLESVTPAEARGKLTALIQVMRAGLRAPLALFPEASWDALKRLRVRDGEADFAEFIHNFTGLADADDRYAKAPDFTRMEVQMAWRGVDFTALDADFQQSLYATATALFPKLAVPAARR